MSQVALYRKYRPQAFKEVCGQEAVINVLTSAIASGSISHAYLFSGSRGTGKTSVARIFSQAIGTSQNDLVEIDAASYTGVDNIRELNEAVHTLPYDSKYKVYIIDEVHMLSKSAFNALLKTLEEPPAHIVFILATTELHKIPDTVVSRCQTFTFRKPSREILKSVVEKTAEKEGYSIDHPSAELVALLGDGSFRDTHGILQKVMGSVKGKKINLDTVQSVTGAPKGELVNDFVSGLALKDKEKCLNAIASAVAENIDMKIYLTLILQKVRAILLLKNSEGAKKRLADEFSTEDFELLQKLSTSPASAISSSTLLELLNTYDLLGVSAIEQLPLELAVMKVMD
jgi:DNA polymerase-3 subunit gamma/tau